MIYPLQVDEENLLEMNDKELNDHMKDLVCLNYYYYYFIMHMN